MNLFFEEFGQYKAGLVLSQQGESYQVELPGGKRSKVKAKDSLLQFSHLDATTLLVQAQQIADEIELDFVWEAAGEEEFGFADLAQEYFGATVKTQEAAGLLLKLHAAPFYFYRKGRGRYKAAPAESVQAALAGMEKKKQQALRQDQYVQELMAFQLPEAFSTLMPRLLFSPDKNNIEYKAWEVACTALQMTPPRLALRTGALASAKDFHLMRFLAEYFPKGTQFPEVSVSAIIDLPVANVAAFSIDDVTTTEIDDAFSVSWLPDQRICVGIHIAAPALGIQRGDALDAIARQRLSTVYMPGDKITMLPPALIDAFTLTAGKTCPAVSLYVTLNRQDWSVETLETRVEKVPVAANLRLSDLEPLVTPENLAAGQGAYPHQAEIAVLWQWVQVLEKGRMAKRESFGLKPEQNNRTDFNFYVENEVVTITPRQRGAPLDKIVAELMIFANSSWGKLLHEHGVPGIYRSQGAGSGNGWMARMQVRMLTHAAVHQGLGVDQYTWSTSPLRRYTDLVNQWQIIACVEQGIAAPLTAPFKPRDVDLFAIISAFEAAYGAYADFQSTLERYWCLRWLTQHQVSGVAATVLKDESVSLVEIPLVFKLPGLPVVPRGTLLKLDMVRWDELDLTVEARLLKIENAENAMPVVISGSPAIDEVTLPLSENSRDAQL